MHNKYRHWDGCPFADKETEDSVTKFCSYCERKREQYDKQLKRAFTFKTSEAVTSKELHELSKLI